MRSMFVIAASAAILSFASVAGANEMSFGLKGGVSIPTGDFGKAFSLGGMGGVYGDMSVAPQFAVGVDVIGNFYGLKKDLKDELIAAGVTDPKFNFTVIDIGVHGKWEQAVETGPEVQVGVGLYNGHSKFEGTEAGISFSQTSSDTKFGFSVGAGYKFWHNESMTLGLDADFNNVSDAFKDPSSGESKSAQYVTVGLDLGFLTHGMSSGGSSMHTHKK